MIAMQQEIPKKRSKTEVIEENQRIYLDLVDLFPSINKPKKSIHEPPSDDLELPTNFGFSVFNPYCFILLHLRNRTNLNPINVQIPQVCIFHDRVPYDIVYSSRGHIRGYKMTNSQIKLRMRDVNKLFKEAWSQRSLPKNETSAAVFAEQEVLMLSDNDLYLTCCKNKIDPFFKKLRYIQNKVSTIGNQPIPVVYPPSTLCQGLDLIKLATESLLNMKNEAEIVAKIDPSMYLDYLNQKIVLFLNYEHNIRVAKATFVYTKAEDEQYYLMNVQGLEYSNLTAAILEREKRLQQREEERNKILLMTPEKQARYRSYENKDQVRTFERVMTNQFNSIVRKLNINTVSDNKRQEVKNELAFKKLHPKSKLTYTQVITSENFLKAKAQVFNQPSRKPLTLPSRRVMRFYNQVKPTRVRTEWMEVLKNN